MTTVKRYPCPRCGFLLLPNPLRVRPDGRATMRCPRCREIVTVRVEEGR